MFIRGYSAQSRAGDTGGTGSVEQAVPGPIPPFVQVWMDDDDLTALADGNVPKRIETTAHLMLALRAKARQLADGDELGILAW